MRTFDHRPGRTAAPAAPSARASGTAEPSRHAPAPAEDFGLLARRLHLGAPLQRRSFGAGLTVDFSGIAGPGRPDAKPLPTGLRADVERRSGLPMDDVRVHRASPAPARIGALAYAQGRDIHLAPGQERHLPHEAWHVVQQKQGRVRPNRLVGGAAVNDDASLEREADRASRDDTIVPAGAAPASALRCERPAPYRGQGVCQRIKISKDGREIASQPFDTLMRSDEDTYKTIVDMFLSVRKDRIASYKEGFYIHDKYIELDHDEFEMLNKLNHDQLELLLREPLHPLANVKSEINTPILDVLKLMRPDATITDLLSDSDEDVRKLLERFFGSSGRVSAANIMLFKSIIATIELHKSGYTASSNFGYMHTQTEADSRIGPAAIAPYDEAAKKELIRAYGLTPAEVLAVEAYSSPNKNTPSNPRNMGKGPQWGAFADGWAALASAMGKIPSLGDLHLEVTSYRTARTAEEIQKLKNLGFDTNIAHGVSPMDMGQRHYMSAALTYSVHADRAQETGGMLAITGRSGRLINPFGEMGFLDGGEILYPPGVYTRYEAMEPKGFVGSKGTVPVFHLREVSRPESGQMVVEDKDLNVVRPRHARFAGLRTQLLTQIEQRAAADPAFSARTRSALKKRSIGDLTIDELSRLLRA